MNREYIETVKKYISKYRLQGRIFYLSKVRIKGKEITNTCTNLKEAELQTDIALIKCGKEPLYRLKKK
jgi:hypothetical protein